MQGLITIPQTALCETGWIALSILHVLPRAPRSTCVAITAIEVARFGKTIAIALPVAKLEQLTTFRALRFTRTCAAAWSPLGIGAAGGTIPFLPTLEEERRWAFEYLCAGFLNSRCRFWCACARGCGKLCHITIPSALLGVAPDASFERYVSEISAERLWFEVFSWQFNLFLICFAKNARCFGKYSSWQTSSSVM